MITHKKALDQVTSLARAQSSEYKVIVPSGAVL